MALYSVSTSQILLASLFAAGISAGSTIAYFQYKEINLLPTVETSIDGKCVNIVNFRNGDAYNCEDVNVLLRQYRIKKIDTPASVTSSTEIEESKPSNK